MDLKNYLSRDPPATSPVDLSIWRHLGGKMADAAACSSDPSDMVDDVPPSGPSAGSREANYEGIPLTVSRDEVGDSRSVVFSLCAEVSHGNRLTDDVRLVWCCESPRGAWCRALHSVLQKSNHITVRWWFAFVASSHHCSCWTAGIVSTIAWSLTWTKSPFNQQTPTCYSM